MTAGGLIVVGSGPAGVSAAEAFRERNATLPIQILTEDTDLPYARPPLSKEYLRGEDSDVSLHPRQWFAERGIDLAYGATVDRIDPRGHAVSVAGTWRPYRALVLACGAGPAPLQVPGAGTALQLRSLADANRLRTASESADSAVVVGAGFIGCEAAASLASRGLSVTLVAPQRAPQIDRFGAQAAERLLALVETAGVRFAGGAGVEAVERGAVRLDDGTRVETDMVLAATGVQPHSDTAESAGLAVRDGRILVGADMRTSAQDIYAAGDVALALNLSAGRHLAVEHWQDAVDQGRVAGAAAAGDGIEWEGVPGFWSTIGEATVKYHAWGDGFDHCRLDARADGFTVWFETDGAVVGVLTHHADDDYDLGEELIRRRAPVPVR